MPPNHLILCRPLLLLPSIFPNIRVFSNESALRNRRTKYWSSSFSISPSNEHLGLISIRMDWLDLLAVQETLKCVLQHYSSKSSILLHTADEPWTEVCDIVQGTGIKTIPKKKKCKKAKWLSEEALQIAVNRREAKSKGEKERYSHLNAESQRIARSDKKVFLTDQCKEIRGKP